jgi:Protein of unknown function (DUF2946)
MPRRLAIRPSVLYDLAEISFAYSAPRMPHRHRSLTAWLGLLAIWLTIAVPLASQWRLAQASTLDAVICGTAHTPQQSSETAGAHETLHLDACGYCGIFAHSPAVGGPTVVPDVPFCLPAASAEAPAFAAPRVARHLRACPRAPPENA